MNKSSPNNPSVDELLNQVKSKYKNKQSDSPQVKESNPLEENNQTEKLLAKIKCQLTDSKKSNINEKSIKAIQEEIKNKQQLVNQSDSILTELKNKYENKKISPDNNFDQNQEEIRYAEQRRQQQRKLLTRQAEQWLKNLDVTSDEGFWFEEFSTSYPSKLEAAIDYLLALDNPS